MSYQMRESASQRRNILDAYMIRYGEWARERVGPQGYPNKSTIYNVQKYWPAGAAAVRAASHVHEEDHPLEEAIESAVTQMMQDSFYKRSVDCLKAKYVGMIRGIRYTNLPDTEAAKYLRIPRQRFYEEIDKGLRFIDGYLMGKGYLGG